MSEDKIVEGGARELFAQEGIATKWDDLLAAQRNRFRNRMFAALTALTSAGYVVVPKEPTEDDADMAAVGRSLMQAIENYKAHPFLQHWHPASDPAEIVGDLLNAYDEQTAAFDKIADEQKRYLGNGNYEIEPACSAEEAQAIARAMIAAREDGK